MSSAPSFAMSARGVDAQSSVHGAVGQEEGRGRESVTAEVRALPHGQAFSEKVLRDGAPELGAARVALAVGADEQRGRRVAQFADSLERGPGEVQQVFGVDVRPGRHGTVDGEPGPATVRARAPGQDEGEVLLGAGLAQARAEGSEGIGGDTRVGPRMLHDQPAARMRGAAGEWLIA